MTYSNVYVRITYINKDSTNGAIMNNAAQQLPEIEVTEDIVNAWIDFAYGGDKTAALIDYIGDNLDIMTACIKPSVKVATNHRVETTKYFEVGQLVINRFGEWVQDAAYSHHARTL